MRERWRCRDVVIFLACVAIAASLGAVYWFTTELRHPDEPFSVHLYYRYGDTDYLPLIYALARFQLHEFVVLEKSGTTLLPFPWVMMLCHAVSVRLFGDIGFVIADVLTMSLWLLMFFFLAKLLTHENSLASVLSLLMTGILGPEYWRLSLLWPHFPVWDFRYPRPLFSGLFIVGLLLTSFHVWQHLSRKDSKARVYLLHGVTVGLCAQGDLHLAIIACFVTGFIFMWNSRQLSKRGERRGWVQSAFLVVTGCLLSVIFFIFQVLGGDRAINVRWGLFPVDRLSPPFIFATRDLFSLLVLNNALWFWTKLPRNGEVKWFQDVQSLMVIILLFIIFSQLAMPFTGALLGTLIQPNHFYERGARIISLGYCAFLIAFGLYFVNFVTKGILRATRLFRKSIRCRCTVHRGCPVGICQSRISGRESRPYRPTTEDLGNSL